MKILAFLAAMLLSTGIASAQPGKKHDRRNMSQEERQQMREQMRDAYRGRQSRPEPQRQLSPQERDKLRRDIQDANKDLRR
jgi:hypothetical protein